MDIGIGGEQGFCYNTANIWQTLGYVFLVFKIVVPILILVFGMIDLGKAVIASKDDEIKKATGSLARKVIAGVIIFLLPNIISVVMSIIGNWAQVKEDFDICKKCITSPTHGCDAAQWDDYEG